MVYACFCVVAPPPPFTISVQMWSNYETHMFTKWGYVHDVHSQPPPPWFCRCMPLMHCAVNVNSLCVYVIEERDSRKAKDDVPSGDTTKSSASKARSFTV